MQDGQQRGNKASDSVARLTAYMRRDAATAPSIYGGGAGAGASARPASMIHHSMRTPSLAPSQSTSTTSDPSTIPLRMLNSMSGLLTVLEKQSSHAETLDKEFKNMRADVKDTLERCEDLSAKMDRTLNAFNETTSKTLKADIGTFIYHDLTQLRTELTEIRASSKEMTAASIQMTKHEGTMSKLEHQPTKVAELKTRIGNLECAFESLRTEISNNNAAIQPVIALAPVMQQVLVTMSQIQATLLQQQQQQPQIIYQNYPSAIPKHPSLQRVLHPEHVSSNTASSTNSSPIASLHNTSRQVSNPFVFTPPSSNPTLAREDTDPLSQPPFQAAHVAQTKDNSSSSRQKHDQDQYQGVNKSDYNLNKQQSNFQAAPARSSLAAFAIHGQEGTSAVDNSNNNKNTVSSGLSDAATAAIEARDPMLSHNKPFVHTEVESITLRALLPAGIAMQSSETSEAPAKEDIKQTTYLPKVAEENDDNEEDIQATQILSSQTPETEEVPTEARETPAFLLYTQATQAAPAFARVSSSMAAAAPTISIPSYRERERSQSLAPTLPPTTTNTSASLNKAPNSTSSTSSTGSSIQLPYKKRKITQLDEDEDESSQLLQDDESSEVLPEIKSTTKVQKREMIDKTNTNRESSPDEPLSRFSLQIANSLMSSAPSGSSTPRGTKLPRLDSNNTGTPSSRAGSNKPTPTRSGGRRNTAKRGKAFTRNDTGTRQSTTRAATRAARETGSPEI